MRNNKFKKRKWTFWFAMVAILGTGLIIGMAVIVFVLRDRIDLNRPKAEYIRYAKNTMSQLILRVMDKFTIKRSAEIIPEVVPSGPLNLVINAHQVIRVINPMIYGTNLDAKTEFEMDVAKFAKDTGITAFRFPGGGSSGYRWQSGDFDYSNRFDNAPLSEISNVIKFANLAGTQLVLTVNVESGTPEEAAQWVRFMNFDPKGMRVDYWELGNEVYGDWDKAYMPGKAYAEVIKSYSTAMKAVDPTIKIGANWGGPRYQSFDEAIMKEAADYIDFVSYHWYPNHIDQYHEYKGRVHPLPEEVMANSIAVEAITGRVHQLIEQYAPHRKGKIEVTIMEWDGSWDAVPSDLKYEYKGIMWSLANAIFYADALGNFARHGVSVANHFCLQEVMFGLIRGWDREAGWGGSRWDGETIRPKGLALKLFARYFGDILIESQLTGSPTFYKERDWRPDSFTGNVPYVEAYASKYSDSKMISIVLTNKHAEQDYEINISLEGVALQPSGHVWILNGPDLKAQNDGAPRTVDIKQYGLADVRNKFSYLIPAHTVNLLQLEYDE